MALSCSFTSGLLLVRMENSDKAKKLPVLCIPFFLFTEETTHPLSHQSSIMSEWRCRFVVVLPSPFLKHEPVFWSSFQFAAGMQQLGPILQDAREFFLKVVIRKVFRLLTVQYASLVKPCILTIPPAYIWPYSDFELLQDVGTP